jgi:hypothetical protein
VIDGRVKSVCEPGATVNGVKVYEKMGGPWFYRLEKASVVPWLMRGKIVRETVYYMNSFTGW